MLCWSNHRITQIGRDLSGSTNPTPNPGNIWSIQCEGSKTQQEQKYSCLTHSFFLARRDLPAASLVASSEKKCSQGRGNGELVYFPLVLSEISGEDGWGKITHILQKPWNHWTEQRGSRRNTGKLRMLSQPQPQLRRLEKQPRHWWQIAGKSATRGLPKLINLHFTNCYRDIANVREAKKRDRDFW